MRVESEGKVWSLSGHDRGTWSKTDNTGPPATGAVPLRLCILTNNEAEEAEGKTFFFRLL